jgi:repressor LexA
MKKLHDIQRKLLDLLKINSDEPLTLRELQEILGVSSHSVIHHHLLQLENKGYLRRNPANPKDYKILGDHPDKLITYVNLYGMASCGPNGTLLDGNPIDRIPIASKLLGFPSEEAFLVKAKGDSMQPKIFENDLVIARKFNSNPKDGDIIVCSHNDEVKIKQLRFSEDIPLLISLNSKYPPLPTNQNELVIEGIVKGILSYRP